MKNKILLLSLSNKFGNQISVDVSHDLDIYYLNIDGFIDYALCDSEKMLLECGQDYYLKREKQAIKMCVDFEDMFFFCSYEVFVNNAEFFKDFKKIYLSLSLKDLEKQNDDNFLINNIAFQDRHKHLTEIAKEIKFSEPDSKQSYQKLKQEMKNLI